jgi:hypothetical protein
VGEEGGQVEECALPQVAYDTQQLIVRLLVKVCGVTRICSLQVAVATAGMSIQSTT